MAGTVYLKLGFAFLIVALIVHAVGYATTRWAIIDILGGLSSYYTGLWQNCFKLLGSSGCSGRSSDEVAWFRAAQILESIGALGLLISAIISIVLLCSQREKPLRVFNLFLILVSGLCIIAGVIVFGIELTNAFDELFGNVEAAAIIDDKLGYSYFLSTVGGGICLVICFPLFVIDYRSSPVQTTQNVPVQYTTAQKQVVIPSKGPVVASHPVRTPAYVQQGQPVQYVVHNAYHQQPAVHVPRGSQKISYSSWQYR